ncbi:MAG: hypothetical protein JWQ54_888 [Mucilaginibacter sp.]|nr:hypothetical protein [Mucilaginibacter sp.]
MLTTERRGMGLNLIVNTLFALIGVVTIGGVFSQQIGTCTLKNGGNCSGLYNFEVWRNISFAA